MNDKQIMSALRFGFGRNWHQFLDTIDEASIQKAADSLQSFLKLNSLEDKRFLDVGCGSGLFSLAARRMKADVLSFDYDALSVHCARKLETSFFPGNDHAWHIEQGSILDDRYIDKLGQFDVVYAWGVLHHTGSMWQAIENTKKLTRDNGLLYLAIYNDQGSRSALWKMIKRLYCSNLLGRSLVSIVTLPYFLFGGMAVGLIRYKNPFQHFLNYKRNSRGMSLYHDWIDWLGGYPYEVAKPEEIVENLVSDNFQLINHKWTNGSGCNEFLFKKKIA